MCGPLVVQAPSFRDVSAAHQANCQPPPEPFASSWQARRVGSGSGPVSERCASTPLLTPALPVTGWVCAQASHAYFALLICHQVAFAQSARRVRTRSMIMSNACQKWLLSLTFVQVKALPPEVCKTVDAPRRGGNGADLRSSDSPCRGAEEDGTRYTSSKKFSSTCFR